MTRDHQLAWARVARAPAAAARLHEPQRQSPTAAALWGELSEPLVDAALELASSRRMSARAGVNQELFEATVAAAFTGLAISEVSEAMLAGWPGLEMEDARFNVEGYLERQADLDYSGLHRTLEDIAAGRGA